MTVSDGEAYREYRRCVHKDARVAIMQTLEQVRSETRSCAPCNGMQYSECVEVVACLDERICKLKDLLADAVALSVAVSPVVASAYALARHINLFGGKERLVCATAYALNGFVLEIDEQRARHKGALATLLKAHVRACVVCCAGAREVLGAQTRPELGAD